jgi:hypothetical protein
MLILGLEPIHWVYEADWYRAETYSARSEYSTDLHCMQYQSFAAQLGSHTPWKINEC